MWPCLVQLDLEGIVMVGGLNPIQVKFLQNPSIHSNPLGEWITRTRHSENGVKTSYSLHPGFEGIIFKSCNPKISPPPRHISIKDV
jgi:hypothetical protein